MTGVPTIETARLCLREQRLKDFDAYAAMWNEEDVLRFTRREPLSLEQRWARFMRTPGFWAYLGFGLFTVEERESGRFVGQVGFFDARRDMEPAIDGALEAGWTFASGFRGRGYGREATDALLTWGEGAFPSRRSVAMIDPANEPSLKLAAGLGFRRYDETVYEGHRVLLLERTL